MTAKCKGCQTYVPFEKLNILNNLCEDCNLEERQIAHVRSYHKTFRRNREILEGGSQCV